MGRSLLLAVGLLTASGLLGCRAQSGASFGGPPALAETSSVSAETPASAPTPAVDPAQVEIGLSEICPAPVGYQQPTWVELYNFGATPVSLAGWALADKGGVKYVLPADLPPMPPEGLVLVKFQDPGATVADKANYEGDNCATLYAREASPEAFRGLINECALYLSSAASSEDLVDYVCWGDWSDTALTAAAAERGIWSAHRWVFRAQPRPGEYEFVTGGSVGHRLFRKPVLQMKDGRLEVKETPAGNWDIYIPQDTTPGKPNTWPSLEVNGPQKRVSYDGGPPSFSWRAGGSLCNAPDRDAWTGHVQVATDPDFQHMVVDTRAQAPYVHRPPLPTGKYYWRVRGESASDSTPWCPTVPFEILP